MFTIHTSGQAIPYLSRRGFSDIGGSGVGGLAEAVSWGATWSFSSSSGSAVMAGPIARAVGGVENPGCLNSTSSSKITEIVA